MSGHYVQSGQNGTFAHELTWHSVCRMSSGFELKLPLLTIVGKHSGPTLGLMAGIHGDEHTGTECLRRLVTTIDPEKLAGTVMAIPVANPLAFEARTRHTPIDLQNLNRVFPGKAGGWLSEQIASVISDRLLQNIEYLIDYHAAGDAGWVDYLIADDRDAALATGADYIYMGELFRGTSKDGARAAGCKTALTPELGGVDCSESTLVNKGVLWGRNAMRYWGMLDEQIELPKKQLVFTEKAVLRPSSGGLLYQVRDAAVLGQVVTEGTLMATIVCPYTFSILEELRAPYPRSLVIHVRQYDGRIHPGDYAYQFANVDTAEAV